MIGVLKMGTYHFAGPDYLGVPIMRIMVPWGSILMSIF